jgi:hypothetical protein
MTPAAIEFGCPICCRRLRVAARHAGHLIRCPQCGARAMVPGTPLSPPPVHADDPTTPLRNSSRPPTGLQG